MWWCGIIGNKSCGTKSHLISGSRGTYFRVTPADVQANEHRPVQGNLALRNRMPIGGSTMECPTCKTHNPEGAKFCFNCGTTLAIDCRNCGTRLMANARFCFNCGTPVGSPSPTTAQRAEQVSSAEHPVPGKSEPASARHSAFRHSIHCRPRSRYISCSPATVYPQRIAQQVGNGPR